MTIKDQMEFIKLWHWVDFTDRQLEGKTSSELAFLVSEIQQNTPVSNDAGIPDRLFALDGAA